MGACLCISDLHLSEARPATTRAFRQFLRHQAHHADSLYILGDLFDLWIGDDDDSPLRRLVAEDLKNFSDSGPHLFLMPGNRDFLIGESFAADCGATLLPDYWVVELAGIPTLLTHGDRLCLADSEYQAFRKQVQTPQWREQFLSASLEERRDQARKLRAASESAKAGKEDTMMDVSDSAVASALAEYGVSRLVHGHTHRPGCYSLDTVHGDANHGAQRIALDEWARRGNYLRVSSNSLELIYFNI